MLTTVPLLSEQAEEERGDMEKVKLDNKRILFNLLPAHVAQHFLMSNPRNMVSARCKPGTNTHPNWISLRHQRGSLAMKLRLTAVKLKM